MLQSSKVTSDGVSQASPPEKTRRASRFFTAILWNWLGVAINVIIGIVVSPYIVRKLGSERFGIWSLVFSLLEYLWFFDLGFNTAVTKFVAHYRAKNEPDQVNRVISSGLFYSSIVALCFLVASLVAASHSDFFLPVANDVNRREFRALILITGLAWGAMFPLHFFSACLDAYQRYDALTRSWVATLLIRSAGCAALLYFGFGLKAMGVIVVIGQLAGNVIAVFSFRASFPQLHLKLSSVSGALLKEMMSYGVHSFVANISNLLLYQGPPVIIAHFRTAAFVGYYMLPFRLLQYLVDAVTRVGFVTRSNVAEMQATGEERGIYNMTMLLNRYCATLFMPAVVYLLVYGTDLVRKWISPEYALHSGPLLPIMAVTVLIAVAGQYNSGSALYGMARHNLMARGLLVESVAGAVGLALVLPHYGLMGAAWTVGVLSVMNRGMFVAWLTCRALHESFLGFVSGIYLRPILTCLPVLALLYAVKAAGIQGTTWPQLISLAVLTGTLYYALSFFTCVTREHRGVLLDWLAKHAPPLKRSAAAAR